MCVCVLCARCSSCKSFAHSRSSSSSSSSSLSLSLVLLRFSPPLPPPFCPLSILCSLLVLLFQIYRWSSKGRDEKAATLQDVPCCTFENSIASFCLEMSPDILLEESCSCSARRSGACIGEETPQERTQRLAMEDANAYADKQAAVLVLQRRRDQVSFSFSMTC